MGRLRIGVALVAVGAVSAIPATTAAGSVQRSKTGAIAFGSGVAPATAAATRTRTWVGKIQKGGVISFRAKVRGHNRATNVISILFNNVAIHCQSPSFTGTTYGEAGGGKVAHHRFVGGATDLTGATVTIKGKFGLKYRHVRGTLTIHGNIGPESNCSTGKLIWVATLQ